jgi:hypothetical protein
MTSKLLTRKTKVILKDLFLANKKSLINQWLLKIQKKKKIKPKKINFGTIFTILQKNWSTIKICQKNTRFTIHLRLNWKTNIF